MTWTTSALHVDIDTGQQLRTRYLKDYIKIKTTKKITINAIKTKGHIEYTIQWRRNPQQEFQFN